MHWEMEIFVIRAICIKIKLNYQIHDFSVLYLSDVLNTPDFLDSLLQMKFVRNVTEWVEKKPVIYHGHTAFLDFSRYV